MEGDAGTFDAMVKAVSAAVDLPETPMQTGPASMILTLNASSRKVMVRSVARISAALSELTSSTATPFHVGAAFCAPDDDPSVAARRARIAHGVARARADAAPVVWDEDKHARLLEGADDAWPEVDPPIGRVRCRWDRWSRARPGRAAGFLILATYALALGLPFLLYSVLWMGFGVDPLNVAFYVAFALLMLTTGVLFAEALLAIEPGQAPPEPERWPTASAVIPAWLPNEHAELVDTLRGFLDHDYPGGLQVVCAYNTDRPFPDVEAELRRLSLAEERLLVLRVEGSRTKAQNLNAALRSVTGEIVGVFDADHRPDPDAFRRAARWIGAGWDGVQGRCTVRLPDRPSLTQRLVAIEFETIYGVAHPGRARRDRFAIFGGSNGYWKASALMALRFAPDRLTEDIDVSARALLAGLRIATDRGIVSSELPPADLRALWVQRGRWAQGWTQVSHRWLGPILRAPHLGRRQKIGAALLFGLREVTPWVTLQLYPILLFHAVTGVGSRVKWLLPVFVVSTVLSLGVGAWQATVAWWWADPRHRSRAQYVRYVGHNIVWFSELKMLISRVAHLRAALGEAQWRVTRRATQSLSTIKPVPDRAQEEGRRVDDDQNAA
jgi:cellulose synthase/poly-beta-1,6-N-acetylglucosamine synthase-like glycosyltransferase